VNLAQVSWTFDRFVPGSNHAKTIGMQNQNVRLHWDLTERILGVYHRAHYEFGDGFLEKCCQRVMAIALREAGLSVVEQTPFIVGFRGHVVGEFYADIVVNDRVLIEVKSCPRLEPRHRAQVMNYLRASSFEVALLLNFGPRREWDRLIYTNDRKVTLAQSDELAR
jgi:GxxExxY protein